MKKFTWLAIGLISVAILGLGGVALFTGFTPAEEPDPELIIGANFSKKYAEELELDWMEVYNAMLHDLGVRHVRLAAYWDELEPEEGEYDWSWLDYQLRQLELVDGKAILVVGRRLPRWPECHVPEWAEEMTEAEQQEEVLRIVRKVVERYKDNPAIEVWQVENEPLLDVFGECPPADLEFYQKEVDLVRSLDDRKIVVTDPGELSFWRRAPQYADILGTSLYRIVWNPWIGYTEYWFTPGHYIAKANFLPDHIEDVWITELQLEAWTDRPIIELSNRELFRTMDLERLVTSIDFATRTGFPRIYLWGVEWWYYMDQEREVNDYWEGAKAYTKDVPLITL